MMHELAATLAGNFLPEADDIDFEDAVRSKFVAQTAPLMKPSRDDLDPRRVWFPPLIDPTIDARKAFRFSKCKQTIRLANHVDIIAGRRFARRYRALRREYEPLKFMRCLHASPSRHVFRNQPAAV
jgi:hypothetical protein